MADPTANQGKGIGLPDDLQGFVELALGDRYDVARDIHSEGADLPAGGGPVGGLGIYDRGHFSVDDFGHEVAFLMATQADRTRLHPGPSFRMGNVFAMNREK